MDPIETIATRLTPSVPAAIATVAVRGPEACDTVLALASLRAAHLDLGHIYFGTWALHLSGQNTAEQVVICRTSDEQVEVHCHGGQAVCAALMQSLVERGCQVVESEAWPSEQQCPLAREAEDDLLRTSTDKAAAILVDQLNGALAQAIENVIECLQAERGEQATEAIDALLAWSSLGQHLTVPWSIVFAGPPNVGKSSLMNAVIGNQVSIVHPRAGTTRDWIASSTAIDGWPARFNDTAGLRVGQDAIEAEGVERTRQLIQSADLVVIVVDATTGWRDPHQELLQLASSSEVRSVPALIAWNKVDLPAATDPDPIFANRLVTTSATTGSGIDELLQRAVSALIPAEPAVGAAIPFRPRHVEVLQQTRRLLRADKSRAAYEQLTTLLAPWMPAANKA